VGGIRDGHGELAEAKMNRRGFLGSLIGAITTPIATRMLPAPKGQRLEKGQIFTIKSRQYLGTLKGLTQHGQAVASTYYQDAFNDALSTYKIGNVITIRKPQ
jgi:hypothetical protein